MGLSNSLDAKIEAAKRARENFNNNNIEGLINALEAFEYAVEAQQHAIKARQLAISKQKK